MGRVAESRSLLRRSALVATLSVTVALIATTSAQAGRRPVAAQAARPTPMSKKSRWLAVKAARHDRARYQPPRRAPPELDPPETQPAPVITLRNLWTREVLPIIGTVAPTAPTISRFLRCHFTGRTIVMAPALVPAVLAAARHFHVAEVDVVSGYRSPKYNLFLHKKGHHVALHSQHVLGHAIDFRLPGVNTWALRQFVRALHLGGVGYYPESRFVHCDVGPVRFWQAD